MKEIHFIFMWLTFFKSQSIKHCLYNIWKPYSKNLLIFLHAEVELSLHFYNNRGISSQNGPCRKVKVKAMEAASKSHVYFIHKDTVAFPYEFDVVRKQKKSGKSALITIFPLSMARGANEELLFRLIIHVWCKTYRQPYDTEPCDSTESSSDVSIVWSEWKPWGHLDEIKGILKLPVFRW